MVPLIAAVAHGFPSQRAMRDVCLNVSPGSVTHAHGLQKSGAWRGVALRRCAAWALCRTHSVKSLANLYQDYASLKLKTRTPWPKVGFDCRCAVAFVLLNNTIQPMVLF